MFENVINFFKKIGKKEDKKQSQENSKDAAKERLHLVLMQDRANVSADFLELMKQEIIDVIKKYIEIDEKEIDVRLTNKENEDGSNGAPALYANIPILNIKNDSRKISKKNIEKKQEEEQAKIEDNLKKEQGQEQEEKQQPEQKKDIEETEKNREEQKDSNTEKEIIEKEIVENNEEEKEEVLEKVKSEK